MFNKIHYEHGPFGKKAFLTGPWSPGAHAEILQNKPMALTLNYSMGWSGESVEFLADFGWLQSLSIVDLNLKDVSSIHQLPCLQSIELITYCKTAIDFSAFPLLTKCALEWRPKTNSLFDCLTLKELFINRYQGKSSEPFGELVNLEQLGVLNSPIAEISSFRNLKKLKSLRLGNLRKLASFDGVQNLHDLTRLDVDTCKSIGSIDMLSGLKNLEFLSVSNCDELESLAALTGSKKLKTLCFYGSTNIMDGDLSPIFNSLGIETVAFMNRKNYSHRREDFEGRQAR